jgi:hypothetical protein
MGLSAAHREYSAEAAEAKGLPLTVLAAQVEAVLAARQAQRTQAVVEAAADNLPALAVQV